MLDEGYGKGDLNYYTKNVIKLYKSEDSSEFSYFKQQCMHCADPACVSAGAGG